MGPVRETMPRAPEGDRAGPPIEPGPVDDTAFPGPLCIESIESPEFRRALDVVPAMIWLASPPGHCVFLNRNWIEFTGRPAGQDLGKGWTEGINSKDWAHCQAIHQSAIKKQQPFRIEYRYRRWDGQERWVLDCGLPLVNFAGELLGYIGSCVDITGHKQTDEALRETEDRYRSVVATMSEGVVVTDEAGVIQVCNESAGRILGLSTQEAIGRPVKDARWGAIHEDGSTFDSGTFPVMVTLATGRSCFNVVMGLPKPDRQVTWISINTHPLSGEDGRPRGVVATFVDITDRKEAEKALLRAHEQLEDRVRSRTRELESANERLRVEIEERQRAEQELRESEERYRLVLSRAPDAIFLHDGERILFANPQTAVLFGVRQPSDLIGRMIWDFIDAEYQDVIKDRIETLQTIGSAMPVFESYIRRADGTTRPIETTAAICPYKGGSVIQIVARDISARKEAEDSLRKSAEQISDLYNLAPCGYHSLDSDGRIVRMNDTELNWLGYDREEVVGVKRFDEVLAAGGREIFPITFGRLKQSGKVSDLEFDLLRKDGTTMPVVINATAIFDDRGRFVMTRSTVFDMTEIKRAGEALRESEERFRQLAEASFEGIAIHEGGRILDANAVLAGMFGYEREELLGKSHAELIPPARAGAPAEPYAADRGPQEAQGVRRDGSTFPIEIRGKAIPFQGRTIHFSAVRDLTERKKTEERSRQHQQELAHVLRLSTMGEMATGLAHELNQPLSAIVSYAQGCLRRIQSGTSSPTELVDILGKVTLQAGRAGAIIRRLRAFVSKQDAQLTKVGINDVVRETVQFLSPDVRRLRLSLDLDFADQLPEIEADVIQIEQVLLNLLRNACEALCDEDRWPRRITVRTGIGERGMISVAVCDTGPGLSPAVAAHLFEPFFTTKSDGMGLGLSISKSIIEAHGGRIWATTNEGCGVTFHFCLPAGSSAQRSA